MRIIHTVFYTIIAIAAVACSSSTNDKILNEENTIKVLWDLIRAGELASNDTSSSVKLHLKDSSTAHLQNILAFYHIDKPTLVKTLEYYEKNPEKQLILFDSLYSYATTQQTHFNKYIEKKNKKDTSKTRIPRVDSIALHNRKLKDSVSKAKHPLIIHTRDSLIKKRTIKNRVNKKFDRLYNPD